MKNIKRLSERLSEHRWSFILPVIGMLLFIFGVLVGLIASNGLSSLLSVVSGSDYQFRDALFNKPSATTIPYFWKPVLGADPYASEGVLLSIDSNLHKGVDAYAIDYVYPKEGMDIYPVLPGKVVFSGCKYEDYGCTVVIRHWDSNKWNSIYYSIYAHVQETGMAQLWQQVDGTQPIARMGKTGAGSHNVVHLHFAVRTSDQAYDGLIALYGKSGGTPVMSAFDVHSYFR